MIAWQKQIRDLKSSERINSLFPQEPEIVDLKTAIVKEVSYATAEKVILEYEWLKCMPAMFLFSYGIYFDGYLGGVVVYSNEYAENLGVWDKYGYTGKIILLSRGACLHWTPKGTASKLIMASIKLLPEKYKVITCTVDHRAGEVGTIYQACNFVYIGQMVEGNREGWVINGKFVGSRSIRAKLGHSRKEDVAKEIYGAEYQPQPYKSRYFYFNGNKREIRELKQAIINLIKPYPKRNSEEEQ